MDYRLKKKKIPARFECKSEIGLDLKPNQTKTTQQYFELVVLIRFRRSSVEWWLCRSVVFLIELPPMLQGKYQVVKICFD